MLLEQSGKSVAVHCRLWLGKPLAQKDLYNIEYQRDRESLPQPVATGPGMPEVTELAARSTLSAHVSQLLKRWGAASGVTMGFGPSSCCKNRGHRALGES